MSQATWQQISELLFLTAQALRMEWRVEFPEPGTLPAPALDAIVDEWCERLALNMAEPLSPPDLVRPWIVVRLVAMSSSAALLAKQGDTTALEPSPNTFRWLLIDEWHGVLRDRWQFLVTVLPPV